MHCRCTRCHSGKGPKARYGRGQRVHASSAGTADAGRWYGGFPLDSSAAAHRPLARRPLRTGSLHHPGAGLHGRTPSADHLPAPLDGRHPGPGAQRASSARPVAGARQPPPHAAQPPTTTSCAAVAASAITARTRRIDSRSAIDADAARPCGAAFVVEAKPSPSWPHCTMPPAAAALSSAPHGGRRTRAQCGGASRPAVAPEGMHDSVPISSWLLLLMVQAERGGGRRHNASRRPLDSSHCATAPTAARQLA